MYPIVDPKLTGAKPIGWFLSILFGMPGMIFYFLNRMMRWFDEDKEG
jgi:hypothetical protein